MLLSSYFIFLYSKLSRNIFSSDNGPEFTAKAIRRWLNNVEVNTLFIERGSPWENGYIESFNGKLRDELLNREIFTTLTEAQVLIADWREDYNQFRPHSSLHYKPPAPEAKGSQLQLYKWYHSWGQVKGVHCQPGSGLRRSIHGWGT